MKFKIIVVSITILLGLVGLMWYLSANVPTGRTAADLPTDLVFRSDLFEFEAPEKDELKERLTELQYNVTQKEWTETPFDNEYWDNHEDGIYVDIVSGEPLFSSTEKFDSGTGWPSFYRPLSYDFVTEKIDYKLIYPRTEIRSKMADSHLGHIILDGPEWNDNIRYCMNSAAMRFVPVADLEAEGLGEYLQLFE